MRVIFQGTPLFIEQERQDFPVPDPPGQLFPGLLEGAGPAQAEFLRPEGKRFHPVCFLQRHKKRIVLQPVCIFRAEPLVILPLGKTRGGAFQQRETVPEQRAVIHFSRVVPARGIPDLLPRQEPLPLQNIQVDEIRVGGKGGKALVRAVAVSRGADRKNLPVLLPRRLQKVEKPAGPVPQAADPVRGRQAADGHQNSTGANGNPLLGRKAGSVSRLLKLRYYSRKKRGCQPAVSRRSSAFSQDSPFFAVIPLPRRRGNLPHKTRGGKPSQSRPSSQQDHSCRHAPPSASKLPAASPASSRRAGRGRSPA